MKALKAPLLPEALLYFNERSNKHDKHINQQKYCAHVDQFKVTLSSLVGNAREVRITLLTVLADDLAVVVLILTQEALRVVVAVDVDLREGVVCRWLDTAFVDTSLQPRQQQLQPTYA